MSSQTKPIKLGVSACLLGQAVRYNGGHKRDSYLVDTLSEFVEFVPTCPEIAIGLGVPRPPIRLLGDPERPRAVGVEDASIDVTEPLERFSRERAANLDDISGYVLKKGSPSCGMARVKVYSEKGRAPSRSGMGIFARILAERQPTLPLEDEDLMNNPLFRENFISRVFVYHRWQKLARGGITSARLIEFHAGHKYLVMAHSQAAYRRLGRMLSNLSKADIDTVAEAYLPELMQTLKRRVSRKRHVNVLQHIMGYLKKKISSGDKAEIASCIDAYRRGEVPLIVPVTLLRHYFRVHPDPYMERQVYLRPYPDKLGLRNAL